MLKEQPGSSTALQWMKTNYSQSPGAGAGQLRQGLAQTQTLLSDYDVTLDFQNLTAEKVQHYAKTIMEQTQKTYEDIAALDPKGPLSFNSLFQPLIDLQMSLSRLECLTLHMQHFHPDASIRDACVEAEVAIDKVNIECSMMLKPFLNMQSYYEGAYQDEKVDLSDEERRFVDHEMRGYKRAGLHLDAATRERVKELKTDLSQMSTQFSKNINDVKTSFTFTRAQLRGMPDSWFTKEKEVKPGYFKMTLKYPDYLPAMESVVDSKIRQKLYTAYMGRCLENNSPLFNETIKKRQELAELLGYKHFADFAIEPKMAKTSETVKEFLGQMKQRFAPLFEHDMQAMIQMAAQETGNPSYKLQPWDMSYYLHKVESQACAIDREAIKAYFPLPVVLKGMLDVYQELLGLTFVEEDTPNKWHDDVKVYSVYNKTDSGALGSQVGSFYLDLHPRDGKYSHAAMWDFVMGCDISKQTGIKDDRQLPVAAMACNFPADDCLSFDNVTTLFHEFGHVMHGICGKTQLPQFHGTNVERDFVEAPSQMLENWCTVPEVLRRMSAHKTTGEPIPDDLIEKVVAAEKVNQGYLNYRQLSFGLFDMAMHTPPISTKRVVDGRVEWNKIQQKLFGFTAPSSTNFAASFGHLMGGYEAGYYGYLMSKTYSADLYAMFKEDPMDSKLGLAYRKEILEPGGSRDAMDSLKAFLGREPRVDAFLEQMGLEQSVKPLAKTAKP